MTPNEARYKSFGLGPVPGGDTPYMQMQYVPLSANREVPQPQPAPTPEPPPEPKLDEEDEDENEEKAVAK